MFEDIQNIEGYLEALRLEKVLYTHEPTHIGNVLNPDDAYVYAWEAMAEMSDEIVEIEWTGSVLHKFCFSSMHGFYELCREHSRRNKIKFRKNPHVIKAEEQVHQFIVDSDAENFCWNLWTPRKIVNKKWDILLIETGCYFQDYVAMIDTLYEIQEYYTEQSELLKQELYGTPKIIKLPTAKKETRKAA
ncbi:MAG: hypothetical protein HFE65_04335 [Clostridiales bacterium]|jgi:hypothetical protein|nr:hypothetical protein [Clostridiales bacterium]